MVHRFAQRQSIAQVEEYITALSWSPLGDWLAIATGNGEVWLWQEGERLQLQSEQPYSVDALEFSADGCYLAAGMQQGAIVLWQVHATGATPWDVLEGGTTWIDRLAWHPQLNVLAFPQKQSVQFWDVERQELQLQLVTAGLPQDFVWSPDGQYLAIAAQNLVHLWNRENWADTLYEWELPAPGMQLAWSPEGRYLAVSNRNQSIGILDWVRTRSLHQSPQAEADLPVLLQGFPAKIRQLAWAAIAEPEAPTLLAAPTQDLITLWLDTPEGWQSWALEYHLGKVLDVAFQPGTGRLASLGADGQVCLWQADLDPVQVLDLAEADLVGLAWSGNGRQLAVGSQTGEVWIFTI